MPDAEPTRVRLEDATIKALQDPSVFGGQPLTVGGQSFDPVEYVAHGYKGVVWKVADDYGGHYAAKITTPEDFVDRSVHDEVRLRRRLPAPVFVPCRAAGRWTAPALAQDFVVTVEEWVQDGRTLHDVLDDPTVRMTGSFIRAFVHQMCDALDALEAAGLAHDDLHDKNVMVRPTQPGERGHHSGTRMQVVVVDTGSLKPTTATRKDIDDVGYLAHHLVAMHNRLHRSRETSPADRRFLACLRVLVQTMTDDGRPLRTGEEIRRQIDALWTQAQQPPQGPPKLRAPFDYISAEHIARDDVLLALFAEAPWFAAVAGNDPVLLTGPRGCGKSTLFRYLALKTHAGVDAPVPYDRLNNTGVYVSCTSDLQNRFGWIRTPEQAKESAPDIVHYFNLLLARETLQTLIAVGRRDDSVSTFGLGSNEQADILEFFTKRLPPHGVVLSGVPPLQQALDVVDQELFVCHRRMLRNERTSDPTGEMFLADLTQRLMDLLPVLVEHPIAFLLDDFSTHRVHAEVQRLLGPIVYTRRASHIFKVSSEKYGTVRAVDGGGTADLTREIVEVDCGKHFLQAENKAKTKEFAVALLRNRLVAAGWKGTPEQLIGEGPRDLAQQLHDGQRGQYYGLNVIRDLCSGDVSTLLLVYRRVLAGCDAATTVAVAPNVQNDAIRAVSRLLLEAIQHHRPHGKEMVTIANEFGSFVASVLKGPFGKDGKSGEKAVQIPRIEVTEGSSLNLSLFEDSIRHELLRRAVFIELDPGNSMKGRTASLRWDFRRVYLPAFGAALHKTQALILGAEAFAWFLNNPKAALDAKLKSRTELRARADERGNEPDDGPITEPLF